MKSKNKSGCLRNGRIDKGFKKKRKKRRGANERTTNRQDCRPSKRTRRGFEENN